mmetsp:Transcript_42071/g.94882  ORF Transcript_42071/g.94882 Transcript_42071/m.94882 type:complete len:228 (+) Transcript_42071:469-1152(+)
MLQMSRPASVLGTVSPYPTVESVTTTKYKACGIVRMLSRDSTAYKAEENATISTNNMNKGTVRAFLDRLSAWKSSLRLGNARKALTKRNVGTMQIRTMRILSMPMPSVAANSEIRKTNTHIMPQSRRLQGVIRKPQQLRLAAQRTRASAAKMKSILASRSKVASCDKGGGSRVCIGAIHTLMKVKMNMKREYHVAAWPPCGSSKKFQTSVAQESCSMSLRNSSLFTV